MTEPTAPTNTEVQTSTSLTTPSRSRTIGPTLVLGHAHSLACVADEGSHCHQPEHTAGAGQSLRVDALDRSGGVPSPRRGRILRLLPWLARLQARNRIGDKTTVTERAEWGDRCARRATGPRERLASWTARTTVWCDRSVSHGRQLSACIFCGSDDISQEHLVADWALRGYAKSKRPNLGTAAFLSQSLVATANLDPVVKAGLTCHECNGGWIKAIDDAAADLLKPLIRAERSVTFTRDEQTIAAAWLFKTTLVCDAAQNGEVTDLPP